MQSEIIVCIPGTWENRTKFVAAVVTSTDGDFMFAGMILAYPKGADHVELEFCDPDELMAKAFAIGGQGKLSATTLAEIAEHKSIVYLHFPLEMVAQKERLLRFTKVLSRCGGIAIKLETSGIAHEWDRWFELLGSANPFDTYCAGVVLVADKGFYYSCGMHNFGLPDAQTSNSLNQLEAADLINRFNYWQILERPILESGATFSVTADSPHFRLELVEDKRYSDDHLFHNPRGLWNLRRD